MERNEAWLGLARRGWTGGESEAAPEGESLTAVSREESTLVVAEQ